MENNIQTKVNKIGLIGKIVSIVLIVLMSIGAFGLLVGGVACVALPKDAVQVSVSSDVNVQVNKSLMGSEWKSIDEALAAANEKVAEEHDGVTIEKTDDGLAVHVNDPDKVKNFGVRDTLKAFSALLIGAACAIVTLVMFLKLCDAFRVCISPFDEAVIKRMNIFAWTLIVCAVVGSLATGVATAAVAGIGNFSFNLNLVPIFAALVVFFLCMIFRYGAKLQQEADETL